MINNRLRTDNGISIPEMGPILALTIFPLINGGFDSNVVYWVTSILICIMLFNTWRYKSRTMLSIDNPMLWYGIFLCWSAFSVLWSVHYVRTIIEFIQLLCYGLVFIFTYNISEEKTVRIGRLVLLTGTAIALFGIGEYVFVRIARISGTYDNPNPFGIYMAMLLLVAWGYQLRSEVRRLSIVSAILLVALALTGSRGSYIAFLVALPLVFIGLDRKKLVGAVGRTILLAVISLMLTKGIMLMAPFIQESIADKTMAESLLRADSFVQTSVAGRLEFWRVAGKLTGNRPVRGYGLGTYFAAYYLEYGGNQWYARFTHNHYLQTAAELGLIGLGLLLAFIGCCFFNGLRKLRHNSYEAYIPGVMAGAVAFVVHIGMDFSWNYPADTVLFFALLAVLSGHSIAKTGRSISVDYRIKTGISALLLLAVLWHISAGAVYLKGMELASAGRLIDANRVYDMINRLYPINSMGYSLESNNYNLMYEQTGDEAQLDKAIKLAERSVSMAPLDGALHSQLGKLYIKAENPDKAEYHLKLGVEYGAYALSRYLDLGAFYIKQGRLEDAEKVMLKGLELKSFAIISVSTEERERAVDEAAQLHLILAGMYQNAGDMEAYKYHVDQLIVMKNEYPFLDKYFKQ